MILACCGGFHFRLVEIKQPFFIHPSDGSSLAMAGLYELWRDPTREDDDPRAWLMTCTVLTTTAEDSVGRIHDRMPLLVERERWAEWLDPAVTGEKGDPRGLPLYILPPGVTEDCYHSGIGVGK